MLGKPVRGRRCPRNGKQVVHVRAPPRLPKATGRRARRKCLRARRPVRRWGQTTISSQALRHRNGDLSPVYNHAAAGTLAARQGPMMKFLSFAGLAGVASIAVHAQSSTSFQPSTEPLVVTATRMLEPMPTLRDTVVITREDLDTSGALSLAEVLQRRAGVEIRGLGGAGQPQSLFLRRAGSAQTLVLGDGLRVGSATVGPTAIEPTPPAPIG